MIQDAIRGRKGKGQWWIAMTKDPYRYVFTLIVAISLGATAGCAKPYMGKFKDSYWSADKINDSYWRLADSSSLSGLDIN